MFEIASVIYAAKDGKLIDFEGEIFNYLPNDVTIHNHDSSFTMKIAKFKGPAVMSTGYVTLGQIKLSNVPNYSGTFDSFETPGKNKPNGLPSSKLNTYFLVTEDVRLSMPKRKDLLSPGPVIHNTSGDLVGHRGFCHNT